MIDFKIMEDLNNLYEYRKGAHHAIKEHFIA